MTIEAGPGGGLRLGIGGAIGSYEEQGVNCEGDVISRERRRFRSIGAEASGRIAPALRVTGHAGHMWTSSEAGSTLAPPYQGFFGGIMGGLDDTNLAMGLGLSTAPGGVDTATNALSNRILPMGFVRIGELDRLHFRVEIGGPPVPGAPPELGRAGLGFRLGDRRRVGFRLDLGVSDFPSAPGRITYCSTRWFACRWAGNSTWVSWGPFAIPREAISASTASCGGNTKPSTGCVRRMSYIDQCQSASCFLFRRTPRHETA